MSHRRLSAQFLIRLLLSKHKKNSISFEAADRVIIQTQPIAAFPDIEQMSFSTPLAGSSSIFRSAFPCIPILLIYDCHFHVPNRNQLIMFRLFGSASPNNNAGDVLASAMGTNKGTVQLLIPSPIVLLTLTHILLV